MGWTTKYNHPQHHPLRPSPRDRHFDHSSRGTVSSRQNAGCVASCCSSRATRRGRAEPAERATLARPRLAQGTPGGERRLKIGKIYMETDGNHVFFSSGNIGNQVFFDISYLFGEIRTSEMKNNTYLSIRWCWSSWIYLLYPWWLVRYSCEYHKTRTWNGSDLSSNWTLVYHPVGIAKKQNSGVFGRFH